MTPSDRIDHAGFAYPVEGLGPGRRLVLWLRGCSLGCDGCMTRELWAAGESSSVRTLARELVLGFAHVDGLTISGGEPFQQAPALLALLDAVRAERDIEILVYSGYKLDEIHSQGQAAAQILDRIDLLIDGRYVERATDRLPWRGSDNQRLHALSARGRARLERQPPAEEGGRRMQLQELGDGGVRLIGIPRRGDLERLGEELARRGVSTPAHVEGS